VDGTTGSLSCSGNITGASAGTVGYWTKTAQGIVQTASNEPIAATSSATTVATFTATGTNNALVAGGTSNFVTIDNGGNIVTTGNLTAVNGTFSGTVAVNGASGITSTQGTLIINAGGQVDVQDALNADSITSDAGVSIAAGNSYTGSGAVTLSSGTNTDLTLDAGGTGILNIADTTVNFSGGSSTLRTNTASADTLTVNNAGAGTLSLDLTDGALLLGGTTRISNAGVGSFITGTTIGSQTFTTNNITDSGALTIATGANGNLTLDANGTGSTILADSVINLSALTASRALFLDASSNVTT
jgi:hypothetical protein